MSRQLCLVDLFIIRDRNAYGVERRDSFGKVGNAWSSYQPCVVKGLQRASQFTLFPCGHFVGGSPSPVSMLSVLRLLVGKRWLQKGERDQGQPCWASGVGAITRESGRLGLVWICLLI